VISTTKADKPWSGRKNRRLFVTSGGQPSGEQIIRKTVHKIKNGQVWFRLNKAVFSIKEKDEVSYRLEDELRDQSTLRTRTLAGRL
jgi:lipopolysaccharide export LptBFGC system permease protein LptF